MSITIPGKNNKYEFDGPYSSTSSLKDNSGVYAILSLRNDKYHLLDVGESAEVQSRVENHDREDCWHRNADGGSIRYAVYYAPGLQQSGRREIEQDIRDAHDVPCGNR